MQKVKTGTFLCWLFGHKFIARDRKEWVNDKGIKEVLFTYFDVNRCVRCGMTMEDTDAKQ